MDGNQLLYALREVLDEDSGSGFLDDQSTYFYLWEAAIELVRRTKNLTSTQSITTVADQAAYTLNADFLALYLRHDGKLFVKLNDGTNDYFLEEDDYNEIYYRNNSTSVSVPTKFAIRDDATLDNRVTGTTTSAGAASLGETILTDTGADFSDVSAGDTVHNVTDGSDGVVLSKTSSTVLVTALFGGTDNDWTSGDTYVIQPQGRLQIVLDPPPATAGYSIIVPYLQRPAPVFAAYGKYRFQQHLCPAIVKYAAWLYKYRDREPNFGDAFYKYFDAQVRQNSVQINDAISRRKVRVSFKK